MSLWLSNSYLKETLKQNLFFCKTFFPVKKKEKKELFVRMQSNCTSLFSYINVHVPFVIKDLINSNVANVFAVSTCKWQTLYFSNYPSFHTRAKIYRRTQTRTQHLLGVDAPKGTRAAALCHLIILFLAGSPCCTALQHPACVYLKWPAASWRRIDSLAAARDSSWLFKTPAWGIVLRCLESLPDCSYAIGAHTERAT